MLTSVKKMLSQGLIHHKKNHFWFLTQFSTTKRAVTDCLVERIKKKQKQSNNICHLKSISGGKCLKPLKHLLPSILIECRSGVLRYFQEKKHLLQGVHPCGSAVPLILLLVKVEAILILFNIEHLARPITPV